MDYGYWPLVLNSRNITKEIGIVQERWIFKPRWSKKKWLNHTLNVNPGIVMLVCGELDLRKAGRIWVRNKKTKSYLENLGFKNVESKRIPTIRSS